jgi:biotin carboxyl carrier protein
VIYEVTVGDKTHRIELVRSGSASIWRCILDGREFPLDVVSLQAGVLSFLVEGRSYEVRLDDDKEKDKAKDSSGIATSIVVGNEHFLATVRDPRSLRSRRRPADAGQGIQKLTAPMPGKVVRILVPAGTEVEAGQPVLAIEAMKMQNEIKSPKKGKVKKITVNEGDAVDAGQILMEVE